MIKSSALHTYPNLHIYEIHFNYTELYDDFDISHVINLTKAGDRKPDFTVKTKDKAPIFMNRFFHHRVG